MREKELKILWGRSGNRCAICKLELTPDGDKETLGEMAHIVARSKKGPRGDRSLTSAERDKYNNLILLCPTHHKEIDKNHRDWPVEKLLEEKEKHEKWVSEQLNIGNISIAKIDNTKFLKDRMFTWNELSRGHVSIVLSMTPMRVAGNQIDTMNEDTQKALDDANLPGKNPIRKVNRGYTRPSEFGLVNEVFPDLPDRSGYSFHIFRSGHCEHFIELGNSTDFITDGIRNEGHDVPSVKYIIRYTDIAEAVEAGIRWLERLWENILPYEYLDFRCTILNTKNTTLYSCEKRWGGTILGYPTKSETLEYKDILSKEHDDSLLVFEVLRWFSNCYGLVLSCKSDSTGDYARPARMR